MVSWVSVEVNLFYAISLEPWPDRKTVIIINSNMIVSYNRDDFEEL
jgi:hypothetical protein